MSSKTDNKWEYRALYTQFGARDFEEKAQIDYNQILSFRNENDEH